VTPPPQLPQPSYYNAFTNINNTFFREHRLLMQPIEIFSITTRQRRRKKRVSNSSSCLKKDIFVSGRCLAREKKTGPVFTLERKRIVHHLCSRYKFDFNRLFFSPAKNK